MALRDPVAVHNSATNVEAHFVKNLLIDSGVEAYVSEDLSPVGGWMLGTLPEIHKPQVWVNRQDLEQAQKVLQEYERHVAERNEARRQKDATFQLPLQVVCEECQEKLYYPTAQLGTIQVCSQCGAYVDVEEPGKGEPYWQESDDAERE